MGMHRETLKQYLQNKTITEIAETVLHWDGIKENLFIQALCKENIRLRSIQREATMRIIKEMGNNSFLETAILTQEVSYLKKRLTLMHRYLLSSVVFNVLILLSLLWFCGIEILAYLRSML